MKPGEYKLLEKLTAEEKFELAVRALVDVTKEMAFMELRFLELVDKLEVVARRLETNSMAEAIRQELDRRESQRSRDGGSKGNSNRRRN